MNGFDMVDDSMGVSRRPGQGANILDGSGSRVPTGGVGGRARGDPRARKATRRGLVNEKRAQDSSRPSSGHWWAVSKRTGDQRSCRLSLMKKPAHALLHDSTL